MGISQLDRDRIEDLGLDPQADRTEDLRKQNTPDTAGLGGRGVEGEPTTHKEK